MKVLLVWEEVPDTTKFFLLDGETAELALKAHGCYVNCEDTDDHARDLAEALEGLEPLPDDDPLEITEPVKVVISGFVM